MHHQFKNYVATLIAATKFTSPGEDFYTTHEIGEVVDSPFDMSDKQTVISTDELRKRVFDAQTQKIFKFPQVIITVSLMFDFVVLYFIHRNVIKKPVLVNFGLSGRQLTVFWTMFLVFHFL